MDLARGAADAASPIRLHAIVLAGGAGRRLEEYTRTRFGEAIPKQYCRFDGGSSLLQQTLARLAPLVASRRTWVVVDRSQVHRARGQLAGRRDATVVEQPCDRGTAAGVLLPLLALAARDPGAHVVLTASDHGVADEPAFRATVARAAAAVAADEERIVLVGATPAGATRDYGWIARGGALPGAPGLERVAGFVEKPDAELAQRLFSGGRAWWNTMVLVAAVPALRRLFRERLPELTARIERLAARDDAGSEAWCEAYAELPAANFSADVLGGARSLAALALPAGAGWTDLGTEERLVEWLARSKPAPARAAGLALTGS